VLFFFMSDHRVHATRMRVKSSAHHEPKIIKKNEGKPQAQPQPQQPKVELELDKDEK
jgi:hypothetical protein